MSQANTLSVLVKALRWEAPGIISLELVPVPGGGEQALPTFAAGSHIDLHLGGGFVRSYSLLDMADAPARYRVAVLRDRASRGGSRAVHEQLRVGQTITISAPRNNFALHEDAARSVLLAGGIGITPILCMARRLKALGRPVEMIYAARSQGEAAFHDEILALGIPVHWHFDAQAGGPPDLRALLAARAGGENAATTHFYACGPTPMLDGFVATAEALGLKNAHIERFTAVEQAAASDALGSYEVVLQKSGKVIQVTPDKGLLATLRDAGADVIYSCEEGICGTCETKVIEGEPDHRDSVLSASERAANKTMMICVSGCKSARLVLDL